MSFSKSLARLIPEDDDIDLIEFMKFRQERDEISDDEIDYERAEEEARCSQGCEEKKVYD